MWSSFPSIDGIIGDSGGVEKASFPGPPPAALARAGTIAPARLCRCVTGLTLPHLPHVSHLVHQHTKRGQALRARRFKLITTAVK